MRRRGVLAFATVVLTSVAACEGGTDVATAAEALPACQFAADVAPISSDEAGKCSAARAYLTCTVGGVVEGCLSDELSHCPGDGWMPDASGWKCTDHCERTEYGVACGAPRIPNAPLDDAGAPASPPDGCRTAGITPGGVTFFCCPCVAR